MTASSAHAPAAAGKLDKLTEEEGFEHERRILQLIDMDRLRQPPALA